LKNSKPREFKITSTIKKEIIKIIDERIREVHVTKENFSDLKGIVRELAEAQKRTEQRVEELAEAQKRTEQRVEELAEAQKRTEQRVEELAEAQKRTEEEIRKLAIGLDNLRGEVGGLSRSFGYAFENEAFRMLPAILKEKYGVEIMEKFIRAEIRDKEINILGFGKKDGTDLVIVGEAKTRIERMDIFDELEEKIDIVKEEYKGKEILKVLVTHFASKKILKVAEERGVIVVQSFEW
jgi:chromosome segregation ATPase